MGVAITGLLRAICCKIYLSRKSGRNVQFAKNNITEKLST